MVLEESWISGTPIASFATTTNGPEEEWRVEMRLCVENDKQYIVVVDPFSDRLMWFDNDAVGRMESRTAFVHLVGVAMCDADVRELKEE